MITVDNKEEFEILKSLKELRDFEIKYEENELAFKQLRNNMWIFDKKENKYIKIYKVYKNNIFSAYIVGRTQDYEFEEGRFYLREI
jgi:hypothetical protein